MSDLLALRAPTTDADFLRVFNRLAVALREPVDDSGVTQACYFEALADLPVAALEAGAAALMREAGRKFFPTSGEWRGRAEEAQRAQLRAALPAGREEPWHFDCLACLDTGWEERTCDGSSLCGRQKKHPLHSYVRVCTCRPTNRTFQRHQTFGVGA